MAKLNGVVLVKEAIEYNGIRYERVGEGKAQLGDILRVDKLHTHSDAPYYLNISEGTYYEVSHFDVLHNPQIIDDKSCSLDVSVSGCMTSYTLFRKVCNDGLDNKEAAEWWVALERKVGEFKVGDLVRDEQCHGIVYDVGEKLLSIRSAARPYDVMDKDNVVHFMPVEAIVSPSD